MSYKSLLTHRCDIYRMQPGEVKNEYGVPIQLPPGYGSTPIRSDVPCYSGKSSSQTFIYQGDPNAVISERRTFHFLKGADIQRNDKILHNGLYYRVKAVNYVRNHHIEAEAEAVESL